MTADPAIDESLIRRLPLPLARLYRRVRNGKTVADRHHTAYFLWEAALKLLGSAAVVAYAERPAHDPDLADALARLARPALGDWWALARRLVPILADDGDSGFLAIRDLLLGKTRADLPHVAELDAAICEALKVAPVPRGKVRVSELFDRLVRYRNQEIGHGALNQRPPEFYGRVGRALLAGLVELLGKLDVLAGRRLIYVEEVRLQKSGSFLVERHLLAGEVAQRIESLEWPAAAAARLPRPQQLYLDPTPSSDDFSDAPAASPSRLASLRPLLVYEPKRDDVYFLNTRHHQRRCEYLCYTDGDHQDRDELEGEQRELLARVLGAPVDPAAFHRLASASQAEADPEPAASPPDPAVSPPRRIGEFELLSELGRGNMGKVYRAWQPSLGRQVALKCVTHADDPKARARFHREIRALGRVDHPHLVKVLTSGFDDEPPFYTMELVEGATLAAVSDTLQARSTAASGVDLVTWRDSLSTACAEARRAEVALSDGGLDAPPPIRPSPAPPATSAAADRGYVRQVVELMRQVALAADALHSAGVVHRDIKPGNIMVGADGAEAVLMDLGLAQLADDAEGRLTRTRQFIGTLRYASPEQVQSVGTLDYRSDIYSLGATLWELLTLRPLYGATDAMPTPELMRRICAGAVEPIRKHHPGIARDLETIVFKCLENDPNCRYATAADLAADLSRWLAGEPVKAQPPTTRYLLGKILSRHRWPIAAAVAAAVVIAAMLIGNYTRVKRLNTELQNYVGRLKTANDRINTTNERLRTFNVNLNIALRKAEEQHKQAVHAQAEEKAARSRAEAAESDARTVALKAEAINRFLITDMIGQINPENNVNSKTMNLGQLIDRVSSRIDKFFDGGVEAEAEIRDNLSYIYHSFGEYSKSADSTGLQVLRCRVSGRRCLRHPSSYHRRRHEDGRATEHPASGS